MLLVLVLFLVLLLALENVSGLIIKSPTPRCIRAPLTPHRRTVFRSNREEVVSYEETFGSKLAPVARQLDAATGGFAFRYADTRPFGVRTVVGLAFLGTNVFYLLAGASLFVEHQQPAQGLLVEAAGMISSWYHFEQIRLGPGRGEVRRALLADYVCATMTIAATFAEMVALVAAYVAAPDAASVSLACVGYGLVGALCLLGSWVYDAGLPYLVLHGCWHCFSALAVQQVGAQLADLT